MTCHQVGGYLSINLFDNPFELDPNKAVDVIDENVPDMFKKHLVVFTGEYLASIDFEAMHERARNSHWR